MSVAHIKSDHGTVDGSPIQSFTNNYEVQIINGLAQRIHKVVVHSFTMGDVEDPEIYAAEPLLKWQNSEEGQWVMAHAIETPIWHRQMDHAILGYRFGITAKLIGRDYTFWVMKWGTRPNN